MDGRKMLAVAAAAAAFAITSSVANAQWLVTTYKSPPATNPQITTTAIADGYFDGPNATRFVSPSVNTTLVDFNENSAGFFASRRSELPRCRQ